MRELRQAAFLGPNKHAFTMPMTTSEALFDRAKRLIPGGVNSPVRAFRSVGGTPFFTTGAEGATLTTADGNQLVDFVCTWGPAIHGHNHPIIRNAVSNALSHGTSFGTPNPYEIEIAEVIVHAVPSVEKVRMCNSGTEATMSCVRLARGFTGRDKIVKFAGCYHGHVDSLLVKAGSGALTFGHPDSAGIPSSFARETIVCPFNDVEAIDTTFVQWGGEIAGVILEPYPANNCLILPQDGFLERLRDLCNQHGAVLIFDEVMTGFRVGPGGVQEISGVVPDLTALGKIIGGGLPVGALGGRGEIMDFLAPDGPVYQAGTLSGNPLAMAAGIAALRLLQKDDPYKRLENLTRRLCEAVQEAAGKKGLAVQTPRAGSMFAIIFSEESVIDYESATAGDDHAFNQLFHYALKNGIYLPPSRYETCFLSTAHTDSLIDQAADVLCAGIADLTPVCSLG